MKNFYTFISANQKEGLNLSQALKAVASKNQKAFDARASTFGTEALRASATLASKANQKAFLYFQPCNGKDTLYTFKSGQSIAATANLLEMFGVEFKTITESGIVYIYNQGNSESLYMAVVLACWTLKARLKTIHGNGAFVGADTRKEAQKVYADLIK